MNFKRSRNRKKLIDNRKVVNRQFKNIIEQATKNAHCIMCGEKFIFGESDIDRWHVSVFDDRVEHICETCNVDKHRG